MAISEASRHEMHTKLEEVLGAQVAATVMEHLPPVGWADVATKRDLDAVHVLMKQDLDAFQVLMKGDLDVLRLSINGELDVMRLSIDGLRQSINGELDVVRLSVDGKLDGLRVEMHREINRLLLWLFPTLITLVGATFAAAKLS
jgi:hypothetical protein